MKKQFLIILLVLLIGKPVFAQEQIERFANSLPVFVAFCGVKAENGVLTIGIFSEADPNIPQSTLDIFKNLRPWSNDSVISETNHKTIEVVPLNPTNLADFSGNVIWVMDANESLPALKEKTSQGIFTIGSQEEKFSEYLFTTLLYENKSNDPKVEKWRLTELIANCDLTSLRYSDKLMSKSYFNGKNCN